jgi:hypothetical protein
MSMQVEGWISSKVQSSIIGIVQGLPITRIHNRYISIHMTNPMYKFLTLDF